MAASHYHGYDGGRDSPSGLANRLASVHLDAGQAQRLSSPAFSAGVVAGDATSGVDALTGVTGK
jgi:hypothetical protein